jgi:hypothetical protein
MSKIIGISGRIGSGKDTAAKYLIDTYNYEKFAFASSLKAAISNIFGWDRILLEGESLESRKWRDTVDQWWADRLDIPHLTPRWVLQHWGTEVARKAFHDDIWIASLEHKLINSKKNIVITDCRFYNEIDAVRKMGGTVIRIERNGEPEWYQYARSYNSFGDTASKIMLEKYGIHSSEYMSVGYKYDHIIDNSGTLDDLYSKLSGIINL